MKEKIYLRNVKYISAVLIITCSILFSESAIGQSKDSWDDVESAQKTSNVLGILAGALLAVTIVGLIIHFSSGGKDEKGDNYTIVEKKSGKKSNEKDSTSFVKSDSSLVEKSKKIK